MKPFWKECIDLATSEKAIKGTEIIEKLKTKFKEFPFSYF